LKGFLKKGLTMKTVKLKIDIGFITIDRNTKKEWFLESTLHREMDQPSVIHADGSKYWYRNGQLYRENDLPAKIYAFGYEVWYKDGKVIKDSYCGEPILQM
jgi:hypothetical protein